MSEHQTERFSEALDRVLTSSQQRKFEQHLSTCDKCTTDYEQYRATIAKVRALPLAKMPVPVRIPADMAPRHSFAEGILGYLRRGRGVPTAIALVAAAGILVFASRQTSTTNPPGAASALRPAIVSPANGLNASQAQAAAGLSVPKAADSTVSCVAALLPGPASPPSTYSNVVTVRGSNGAATEITIAAPSATVHAGDSIAVFAHATVSLQSSGAKGSTPTPPISIGPCVDASTPGVAQAVNSSALVDVSIPGSAPAGEKIVVYATVPAGSGNIAALPQLQAMLTLTVQ